MNSYLRDVVVLSLGIIAQGSAQTPGPQPGRPIGLGEARTVRSAILKEDRELQIALPETYGRTNVAYPVLFLLDGSSHLLHGSATARFLAAARNRIPEMIVVAIPNTNRNRDMTPGPGAATFQRVLADELIPWVEQNYRAAPERVLVGHSLSASFAVHTLLNRPELFDGYVVTSAPLWRYDGLDKDVATGLSRAAKAGTAVYLAVGEHENLPLRGGMKSFADWLQAAGAAGAPVWSYVDMKDEDHNSTPQRALYNALETRYAEWRFPFFENYAELERVGGLKGVEAHYERVSGKLGFRSPPPEARLLQVAAILADSARHAEIIRLAGAYAESYPAAAERLVNQVGYDQMRRGDLEGAVQTLKKNAETFPNSPNVFDSLGEAYCRAGNPAAGAESYRQAARVAEARSHPRLVRYQERATQGCSPAP